MRHLLRTSLALLLAGACAASAGAGKSDRAGRALPLIELPTQVTGHGRLLALIISGDGGWAHLDQAVARDLVANGVAVVGLDSPKYFKTRRNPEGVTSDVTSVLRRRLETWNRSGLVLIGFSTGADILPFVVNRLPADLRDQVRLVVLIGPYGTANFQYRLVDWLDAPPAPSARQSLPELRATERYRLSTLCIHGKQEEKSLCRQLPGSFVRVVTLPGGHHFNRDFARVGRVILDALKATPGGQDF